MFVASISHFAEDLIKFLYLRKSSDILTILFFAKLRNISFKS